MLTIWRNALALGIDHDVIRKLLMDFSNYDDWEKNVETAHLAAYMEEALLNLWSTAESVPGAITMNTGCGAGGSLAGMCFTLAFSKPVRKIRQLLTEAGLCISLVQSPAGGEKVLDEVSYEDDFACVISAPAEKIISSVQEAVQIIWQTFAVAGFTLNFTPNKTAVMIQWSGVGAPLAKKICSQMFGNRIPFIAGRVMLELDVVSSYKHMGSYTDISQDITCKCAAVAPLGRKLHKRIFSVNDITKTAKQNIL